ncbi:MAG: hypothetical protein ACTS4U_00945 [Candidatus Hodgkinia cicadicola]
MAVRQASQTKIGIGRNGLSITAAAGIMAERRALMAKVIAIGQVPRAKTQELGVRTGEILAKTSLKGPIGVFFFWTKVEDSCDRNYFILEGVWF